MIELPIALLGRQPIPEPMRKMLGGTQEVASFEASTAVERGDFGVGVGSWAATMVVGSEVGFESSPPRRTGAEHPRAPGGLASRRRPEPLVQERRE